MFPVTRKPTIQEKVQTFLRSERADYAFRALNGCMSLAIQVNSLYRIVHLQRPTLTVEQMPHIMAPLFRAIVPINGDDVLKLGSNFLSSLSISSSICHFYTGYKTIHPILIAINTGMQVLNMAWILSTTCKKKKAKIT